MENKVLFGKTIKQKRLALNLTMDVVANKAGITRQTLSAIENGEGNYSINALFKVLDVLMLDFTLYPHEKDVIKRQRAQRINSKLDKKINMFITMSIEYYCAEIGKRSSEIYPKLVEKGVIDELTNDYEMLHSLSPSMINGYIETMLKD